MSDRNDNDWSGRDEDTLRRALALAKAADPDAATRERAFAAVHAAWLERGAAARSRQRWIAAAAAIVLAVGAAWFVQRTPESRGPVARVERAIGTVNVAGGAGIEPSTPIVTGESSGVLLRVAPTLAVRLGPNTSATLTDASRLELASGRVFVATSGGAAAPFNVVTPFGEVRHVGTQFEVATDGELEVAVREGSVAIDARAWRGTATAGEVVALAPGRDPVRSTTSASDPRWAWIGTLPAPVEIEGRSLDHFLAWYAGETGLRIEYDAGATRERAGQTILHGTVDGLAPDEALAVVAASAGVTAVVMGDALVIGVFAPTG